MKRQQNNLGEIELTHHRAIAEIANTAADRICEKLNQTSTIESIVVSKEAAAK